MLAYKCAATEDRAFILVNLFAPCRFYGLNVYQVAGLTDKVPFVGGTVLDDHDLFEVNPEILNPFLAGNHRYIGKAENRPSPRLTTQEA
jgi:hypothetical protein